MKMTLDRFLSAFLVTGLLCGITKPAMAGVNAADCKPFRLTGMNRYLSLNYIDCSNRQHSDRNASSHVLGVKAGTKVFLGGNVNSRIWPIGEGMTLSCIADGPPNRRNPFPHVTCKSEPPPSNCKPIDVIYDNAHYWVNLYYTPCGEAGQTYVQIPSEGMTVMAQNGTEVLMGPA